MAVCKSEPIERPAALKDVAAGVIRRLDIPEVLRDALRALGRANVYGPVVALNSMGSYLDEARRLQRRLKRARASMFNTPGLGKAGKRDLFVDAHFYLICWSRIGKLARFVRNTTQFRRAGLVLRRYATELDQRIGARDHLEHFEERLPGGGKERKLRIPNELLGMRDNYLTYGGSEVEVGPVSLHLLLTIAAEFRTAVLFDAVDALAKTDPSRLLFLLRRAHRDAETARITRRVQNMIRG